MDPPHSTFVKICGITRLTDARAAVRAGANALGFVFAKSPRRIGPAKAKSITAHVHPAVRKFGVFVDAEAEEILRVVGAAGLDAVQLQGHESPALIMKVKSAMPHVFVAKVIRAENSDSLAGAAYFDDADAIFFDPKDVSKPLDRSLPIPREWIKGDSSRLVVSGGLNSENVGKLVSSVRPWGIDVSSGVEVAPGKKDPEKIRAFMRAVRTAETSANPRTGNT